MRNTCNACKTAYFFIIEYADLWRFRSRCRYVMFSILHPLIEIAEAHFAYVFHKERINCCLLVAFSSVASCVMSVSEELRMKRLSVVVLY